MSDHLFAYEYTLPKERIAAVPATPRDSARLFVYDTDTNKVTFDVFKNLSQYVPVSLLVLNDTKVAPARIELLKQGGGRVEVLFLFNNGNFQEGSVKGMVDRRVSVGDVFYFDDSHTVRAVEQDKHIFTFRLNFPGDILLEPLKLYGRTPVPKYIPDAGLSEDEVRERYQSIYAKHEASIAAPTAGLHFTNEVFASLEKRGVERKCITLDVGQGTFAPVNNENFKSRKLHAEHFEVSRTAALSVQKAKKAGIPVGAVGTTTVRVLESAADSLIEGREVAGVTDIFIFPPYSFRVVDYMITNFHLPKSSLMCLVEAFLEHKKAKLPLVDLYTLAIKEKFRFYSFGDAMLIL